MSAAEWTAVVLAGLACVFAVRAWAGERSEERRELERYERACLRTRRLGGGSR